MNEANAPVVVGVDFSEHSRNALTEAFRIARWRETPLHVVHVLTADIVEDYLELYRLSVDETLERTRAELEEFCTCLVPGDGRIVLHPIIGHPYHDLVGVVEDVRAGLLVMGSRGTSTESQHTGVIAAQFARRAPVPVLLVRQRHDHPFKRVTACTDFSPEAEHALLLAAEIAQEQGASLDVVHIHYPPWLLPRNVLFNLERTPEAEFREKYQALLDDRLTNAVAPIRQRYADLDVTNKAIAHSNVHYGIDQHLQDSGCELVVVGSRGRSRLKELFIGSTAERLVRHSPCSVLVDRPVKV